jgi:tRNA-dihydrouridine synthase 3
MSHDLEKYLKNKGKDIHFIKGPQELQDSVPFVVADRQAGDYQVKSEQSAEEPLDLTSIIDTTTSCPLFDIYGYCEHGWKCRFLGAHVRPLLDTETPTSHSGEFSGWKLVTIPEKQVDLKDHKELNVVSGNDLKEIRLFPYTQTIPYLQIVDPAAIEKLPGQARRNNESKKGKVPPTPKPAPLLAKDMDEEDMMNAESAPASVIPAKKKEDEEEAMMNAEPVDTANSVKKQEEEPELAKLTGAEEGKDDVPMRAEEKKRLDWRGKTYLAPLTTVGNLVSLFPFRS